MELSAREYELIKYALEHDVKLQQEQFEDIGDDIRFEIWLIETKELLNKVSDHLKEIKNCFECGDKVKEISTGRVGELIDIQYEFDRYQLTGTSGWRYSISNLNRFN